MKVTQVAVRPTEASLAAGRPALTPELLAASGARYSRNNEGLDAILSKIDPMDLDRSVDSIFRMIDYGHQSIADMVPVSMFIDNISLWLAFYVWSVCPTASGQESSTRYIKLSPDGLIPPSELGLPDHLHERWRDSMARCFGAYSSSLKIWEQRATEDESLAGIPRRLLDDGSEKSRKQVARMKRNYGFDRARYFLPVAAATNMMLLMPARGWVQLCQLLASHALPEAKRLGEALKRELELSAPRMTRHAGAKPSTVGGLAAEFERLREAAKRDVSHHLQETAAVFECPPHPMLETFAPPHLSERYSDDLRHHENRYAWIGESLRRTTVRFGWDAVAFAEIRDLNRHRTGNKNIPLIPQGFYCAMDQLPSTAEGDTALLSLLSNTGREVSLQSHTHLSDGESSYIYWTVLGTQFPFEHSTAADKFIYEAELRTGTGSHFRYAKHLHDVLALWYDRFPATRKYILEGTAEPER